MFKGQFKEQKREFKVKNIKLQKVLNTITNKHYYIIGKVYDYNDNVRYALIDEDLEYYIRREEYIDNKCELLDFEEYEMTSYILYAIMKKVMIKGYRFTDHFNNGKLINVFEKVKLDKIEECIYALSDTRPYKYNTDFLDDYTSRNYMNYISFDYIHFKDQKDPTFFKHNTNLLILENNEFKFKDEDINDLKELSNSENFSFDKNVISLYKIVSDEWYKLYKMLLGNYVEVELKYETIHKGENE